jgi:hypothetical protein
MKTLFVTSFDPALYEASGRRLVESFAIQHIQPSPANRDDRLLCCVENSDMAINALVGAKRVLLYAMDNDKDLKQWLADNADIIPDYLGGTAKKCDCPNSEERHAKHRYGCRWQWMNRNASRWFRKVISLIMAMKVAHDPNDLFDYVVWLDADTYFKKALPHKYLAKKLKRAGLFYFRGHRPAIESGILGFSMANDGDEFVASLRTRYLSGSFRRDERWDDGYQLTKVVESESPRVATSVDLVHPTKYKSGSQKTNDVIPTTDIAEYLVHEKGRHGTGLNLMK